MASGESEPATKILHPSVPAIENQPDLMIKNISEFISVKSFDMSHTNPEPFGIVYQRVQGSFIITYAIK